MPSKDSRTLLAFFSFCGLAFFTGLEPSLSSSASSSTSTASLYSSFGFNTNANSYLRQRKPEKKKEGPRAGLTQASTV